MKTRSSPVKTPAALARLVILAVCILAAACLPACTSRPAAPSAPARQQEVPAPRESLCLSLALPLQGPARDVAEKIARGAAAATRDVERRGTNVTVHMLDVDQPDWTAKLAALPPECALVGGPTHAAAYAAAKNSPAARGRAFFTFLPQLEPGDEGVAAWRFFPGPQDQMDALLNFLQIDMGFTSYGVFYPDEPYGRRMTEIFRQRAAAHGAVVHTARYTPGAAIEWPNEAAKLVGRQEVNKTPFPTAKLQAVFLPNSWRPSADQLITSLHYNGEDRLVLLGDAIWGEKIQHNPPVNLRNYQLAIFPGAWNPGLSSPGAQALRIAMQGAAPDFWIGLGYDFVHFAAQMQIPAGWTPQLVARRAMEAQRAIAWSMAPIAWDAQGKATQRLFVFSPVAGGYAPVQLAQLRASWSEAQARFAERVRTAQNEKPGSTAHVPIPVAAPPPWLQQPVIAPPPLPAAP